MENERIDGKQVDGEQFLKYGGIKFQANAPAREINQFVKGLPEDKRASLQTVARALVDAGLISLEDEFTTIDDEMKPHMEGEPGPDEGSKPPRSI